MVKARDAPPRATRGSLVVDADGAQPRRGPVGLEAVAEDAVLEERELGRVAGAAVRPDPLPEVANVIAHVVVAQREAVREERDLRGVERRPRHVGGRHRRVGALVHALPVLLELAHDGAADRSRAAALEPQQVARGELDGEQGERLPIIVVQPARCGGDIVEVAQLRVRAAHAARRRQGFLAVDDRGIEPLEPDLIAERQLPEVRKELRAVLPAHPLRQ